MSKLSVVVGGQFGSEGKGAIAAYLSSDKNNPTGNLIAVRVAGPNAGHTVLGNCPPNCENTECTDAKGDVGVAHRWRLRQIPVAAVTNPNAQLIIGAGSEVDAQVVREEADELDAAGYDVSQRLIIDNMATVLEEEHAAAETHLAEDGRSTGKGIGAARMARVMREATVVRQTPSGFLPGDRVDTARYLNAMLRDPDFHVLIEGTQGYGLGLHTKFYPFTTSSDCRAIDFLAMAGISPWISSGHAKRPELQVWVVFRTRPIRIAGNSGPLEGETSWNDLGLPSELTTVTRKVRRVGGWDPLLAREAICANGGGVMDDYGVVRAALTMADHEVPGIAGMNSANGFSMDATDNELLDWLIKEKEADLRAPIELVGTGPASIIDLREGN